MEGLRLWNRGLGWELPQYSEVPRSPRQLALGHHEKQDNLTKNMLSHEGKSVIEITFSRGGSYLTGGEARASNYK